MQTDTHFNTYPLSVLPCGEIKGDYFRTNFYDEQAVVHINSHKSVETFLTTILKPVTAVGRTERKGSFAGRTEPMKYFGYLLNYFQFFS